MPRNPSEWARIEAELDDAKERLTRYLGKSEKEMLLREIRKLESQLGIEPTKYSGAR